MKALNCFSKEYFIKNTQKYFKKSLKKKGKQVQKRPLCYFRAKSEKLIEVEKTTVLKIRVKKHKNSLTKWL